MTLHNLRELLNLGCIVAQNVFLHATLLAKLLQRFTHDLVLKALETHWVDGVRGDGGKMSGKYALHP